jgi:hypothetical protein
LDRPLSLEVLAEAFPLAQRADALRALNRLRVDRSYSSSSFAVQVEGETRMIPERIHFSMPIFDAAILSGQAREIAHCLLSRSTDGYARKRAVPGVLSINQPWSVPFVVRLIGEYVVEILDEIERNLELADRDILTKFLDENPAFRRTTAARVASYWDAYYRHSHPARDYIGFRLLRQLGITRSTSE